jgi:uncharacterized protein (TIGR02594 family)
MENIMSVPTWMPIAQSYVGTDEIRGSKDNPVIVQYFDDVGHGWVKDDETPWCAAFVGAVLAEAGYEHTGSLAARSYLKWGHEAKDPKYGDVVVFWRGKKDGWQGHVGFFVRETKEYVYVLGGNQGNSVNVSRYSKSRVLGYRRPASLRTSRTVTGAGGAAVGAAIKETADRVDETRDILLGFPVDYIQYLGIALMLVSLGLVVYARYDDIKKKGR